MIHRCTALAVASTLLALPGAAQNVASLSIGAEAITVGITITTLRDLVFGTVPRGVTTIVQPTDPGAGEWQVGGNRNAFVRITFTLPTVLTNLQASPGSTMPISFSNTSAAWRRATNDPTGANLFDPGTGTVGRFGPTPNPLLFIWIGGAVDPAVTAGPGLYRGSVIVTLAYL